MKTIKIIDLLNKNNKPKKIKYQNYIWNLTDNTYDNEKIAIDLDVYLASVQICDLGRSLVEVLNDKVQILEDILDTKEKEYLSNVIRPFRNRIEYIKKNTMFDGKKEAIIINYIDICHPNEIYFPSFEKETMYKNMEENKEYTLEELGI